MKLLKIYVLGAVFLTFFCCLTTHIDENYNYDTFMMQFARNYTGEEKDEHEKIFNKNYAELISLIK